MKYEKIAQKPYCCTAACLEMILKRNGINDYEQEDIAYDLGLIVPLEYVDRFKKVRTGPKPIAGYGTQIQKEEYSVNNFFKKNNIPLVNEYHYITDIKEAKAFLKDNEENDILVCLHCATLYDAPHANWGHMVLYDHMEDEYFVFQDPADNHDIEKIKLDKVLEAIKVHGIKKAGGFWLIKKKIKGGILMKKRIVWNLTNNCPLCCSICAASANQRRKHEDIDKYKILESILTLGKDNVCIDFSGGDPLMHKEDINLIKNASKIIGKENVSISSIGLSIEKLSDEEILQLSNSYDLTYDFPIKYNSLDKRDKRYNTKNYEQAKRLNKLGLDVNIFIPLQDMEEYLIDELAKDLSILNPKSISVIRLMPVGFLLGKRIERFNNIESFKYLKDKLISYNYKGNIKATCSLRTLINDKVGCNMLSEKYGVDHLGNLYSCIWAADIIYEDNPFLLGNLLVDDMEHLIYKHNDSNFNKNECAVCKYLENKTNR